MSGSLSEVVIVGMLYTKRLKKELRSFVERFYLKWKIHDHVTFPNPGRHRPDTGDKHIPKTVHLGTT